MFEDRRRIRAAPHSQRLRRADAQTAQAAGAALRRNPHAAPDRGGDRVRFQMDREPQPRALPDGGFEREPVAAFPDVRQPHSRAEAQLARGRRRGREALLHRLRNVGDSGAFVVHLDVDLPRPDGHAHLAARGVNDDVRFRLVRRDDRPADGRRLDADALEHRLQVARSRARVGVIAAGNPVRAALHFRVFLV